MRYAVLAFITMIAPPLSGCLSQEPPNLGSSSDPAERLSNWRRCLETSYAEARKKTADANAPRRYKLPRRAWPFDTAEPRAPAFQHFLNGSALALGARV
jgi:hypothetical protein